MNVADYIFLGIMGVMLIFGFAKGFGKIMLNSFISFIIAIACTYALTSMVAGSIYVSDVGNNLQTTILQSLNDSNPLFAAPMHLDNGAVYVTMNDEAILFADAFAANMPKAGILSGFLSNMIVGQINMESLVAGTTVAEAFAPFLTVLCINAIAGIVFFIVISIFMSLLKKGVDKLTKYKFIGYVDRIFGIGVTLAIGLAIVMGLLTLVRLYMTGVAPIMDAIQASTIVSELYEINIIEAINT